LPRVEILKEQEVWPGKVDFGDAQGSRFGQGAEALLLTLKHFLRG
jgi:hypothetical protein